MLRLTASTTGSSMKSVHLALLNYSFVCDLVPRYLLPRMFDSFGSSFSLLSWLEDYFSNQRSANETWLSHIHSLVQQFQCSSRTIFFHLTFLPLASVTGLLIHLFNFLCTRIISHSISHFPINRISYSYQEICLMFTIYFCTSDLRLNTSKYFEYSFITSCSAFPDVHLVIDVVPVPRGESVKYLSVTPCT